MIHRVFNCNKMYAAFIAFDGLWAYNKKYKFGGNIKTDKLYLGNVITADQC